MAGSVPPVSEGLRVMSAVTGAAEDVVVEVDCSITTPALDEDANAPVLPPDGLPG